MDARTNSHASRGPNGDGFGDSRHFDPESKSRLSFDKASASALDAIELATRSPLPPSTSTIFTTNALDNGRVDHPDARAGGSSAALEETTSARDSQVPVPINSSELAPVDGGFGAWSFLFAAYFVETIVWGFPVAYGTFLDAYLRDPVYASQPNAQFLLPMIGTLTSGLMYTSSLFVFPLVYRYPQHRRKAVVLGTLICFASLFGASYTTHVVNLIICQGVLYAIGGAILYNPVFYFVSEWFVARRGLASGVIYAGTASGGLFIPLVLPGLIERYGVSITLRILAVVFTGTLIPLLPFLKGRLPVAKVSGPVNRSKKGANAIWVKNPGAGLYMVANLLQSFGWFIPLVWLPTFASDLGLSPSNASLILALLNGASVVGRLVTGTLADRFDPWLLVFTTLIASCLSTFILWGVFSSSLAGLIAFGLIYGMIAGGWSSMWSSVIRTILKDDDPQLSTTMVGYLMLVRGLGNLLTTPIAAAIQNPNSHPMGHVNVGFEVGGGKFENVIIYTGTCFAGATLMAGVGWAMKTVKERKVERRRGSS